MSESSGNESEGIVNESIVNEQNEDENHEVVQESLLTQVDDTAIRFPDAPSVKIVGTRINTNGRSCTSHETCGEAVFVGSRLMLKEETETIGKCFKLILDGVLCNVVKAYLVDNEWNTLCHVGYLSKEYLHLRTVYHHTKLVVAEDFAISISSSKRYRSHRNHGMVRCVSLDLFNSSQ